MYTVKMPTSHLKHSKYKYVCSLKGDKFYRTSSVEISLPYHLHETSVKRDNWNLRRSSGSDIIKYDEQCQRAHLRHLIFHCSGMFTISDLCKQIERVCSVALPFPNALSILNDLTHQLLSLSQHSSFLLFLVAIGNLFTNPSYVLQENIIDQNTAKNIMERIQCYSLDTLPMTCRKYMLPVCNTLCRIIYGTPLCTLQYLNACYPFYGERTILDIVQDNIKNESQIVLDDDAFLCYAFEFSSKLYFRSMDNPSKEAKQALDTLLRHMPLRITLHTISMMSNKCKVDISCSDTNNMDSIFVVRKVRILSELKAFKKIKDFSRVYNLWMILASLNQTIETEKAMFEDAITEILSSLHHSTDLDIGDMLIKLIDQFNFFTDNSGQKLLDTIIGSQNHCVNNLLFKLTNCQKMCAHLAVLSVRNIQSFFQKYISSNFDCGHTKEDFSCFLTHTKYLWRTFSGHDNSSFKDALVNVVEQGFARFGPKEMMRHLNEIDDTSNPFIGLSDTFVDHLKHEITDHNTCLDDLTAWLPTCEGNLIVNNRLVTCYEF